MKVSKVSHQNNETALKSIYVIHTNDNMINICFFKFTETVKLYLGLFIPILI